MHQDAETGVDILEEVSAIQYQGRDCRGREYIRRSRLESDSLENRRPKRGFVFDPWEVELTDAAKNMKIRQERYFEVAEGWKCGE
jgi:hypothetical protein